MAKLTMKRPNLLKTSKAGNRYVKVTVDGKLERVVVDPQIVENWDQILTMDFDVEHYDSSMTEEDKVRGDGKATGPAFDRVECTDFTTATRETILLQHDITVKKLLKEAKLMIADPDKLAS